jgi:peptidoglycan/xylan/chitin deacetylase (PgdA/CDA1 family)
MNSNDTTCFPILIYHGIRRSAADPLPPGWGRPHAIDAASFSAQLDAIIGAGLRTIRLADLELPTLPPRPLAITFDDGHRSDYEIAAPELRRRGLTAAFFITASFLGRPGYLRREQLHELREWSFEIGSHGLTHKRLTEVGPAELWREVLDSKRRLEDLIGAEVGSFAVPSGSYNDAVLQAVWAAGYRRIMTSDFGYARREHSVMHRMGVMAHTGPREFQAFLTAGSAWAARHRLLQGVGKRLRRAIPRLDGGSLIRSEPA